MTNDQLSNMQYCFKQCIQYTAEQQKRITNFQSRYFPYDGRFQFNIIECLKTHQLGENEGTQRSNNMRWTK